MDTRGMAHSSIRRRESFSTIRAAVVIRIGADCSPPFLIHPARVTMPDSFISAADLYEIRPAAAADVPLIFRLIRELAEFERLAHEVVGNESLLHEHLFGNRPTAEVLLACVRETGEAAGMALFFQNFSTFLTRPGIYLEDLYVRPPHRGRGVGKALLRQVARLAVNRGCGRFEWAVLDWNENAIGFYRKLGARLLEDWRICRVTGEALQKLASS
jgi:GNAT superfamily N-acetyltransferase